MKFLSKLLALTLSLTLLVLGCVVPIDSAAAVGTEANPENANNRYFAAAGAYLLNTDLAAGDKDGYWYTFTADSSGIICVDATAKDAKGADTDSYQVTVKCNGKSYYAFADIYTRPITPYRVNRGDKITIHLTAKPDKNGNYPKLKVYCNITTVYGNISDPVLVKSDSGFVANVPAGKSIVYLDSTKGGSYGGKGLVISYNRGVISRAEVEVNGTYYKDSDNDGVIELMLPGDPDAMVAVHPTLTIYNSAPVDCTYFVKVVNSAAESSKVFTCNHKLTRYYRQEPCHKSGREEFWHCSSCNGYFTTSSATKYTDPSFCVLPPDRKLEYVSATESTCKVNGVLSHWYCPECKGYYSDSDGKTSVSYSSLVRPLKSTHDFKFSKVISQSTIKEHGSELYVCSICGENDVRSLPLLERWKKGDVNNDGVVNALDANLVRRMCVGYESGEQGLDAADYNDDGDLNAKDSYLIRLNIAGLS